MAYTSTFTGAQIDSAVNTVLNNLSTTILNTAAPKYIVSSVDPGEDATLATGTLYIVYEE